MDELMRAEKRARRLLELAALLAIVAIVIVVIDMIIKQQIVRAAVEATRAISDENRSRTSESGPHGPDTVGDVGDADPLHARDNQDTDVPVPVD